MARFTGHVRLLPTTHKNKKRPRRQPCLPGRRRPPSQYGQTSPPRVPRTWSCQPSRFVARPVLSPQPLAGCLGAWNATMPDSQTVRALQHSIHHLAVLVCIIWAAPAPPSVESRDLFLSGRLQASQTTLTSNGFHLNALRPEGRSSSR